MEKAIIYIIVLIFCLLGGGAIFIVLSHFHESKKIREEEREMIESTSREYEENYLGTAHEDDITPASSIIDLMLKYHKKELMKVLRLRNENDVDYVVLTYLNEMMRNTYFESYPFWSVLHAKEAKHSLLMLRNALEGLSEEDFVKVRDIIFAWLNYVFDLDKELIDNRNYIRKEDMIKILEDVLSNY